MGQPLSIGAVSSYGACTQGLLSVAALPNNRLSGFTGVYPERALARRRDAENRMISTAGVSYTYDGDGRRVKKSNGTLYWYGAGSNVMMETDLVGTLQDEYVFFNGQRIARRTASGAVYYFFSDHLGSSRIMTDSAGTVVEDSDFYPFGGERVVVDSLNNNYKFAGHERDSESGLDYFIARHYAFTLGRFLQPDLPFADQRPSNPQTWNLYPYARNNPLYFVDPTGRAGCPWNPCTGTDSQGVLSGRWPIMGTVPVHGDIKTVARTFAVVNIAWNSKGTVLAWNITLFGKLLYSPAGEWSYGSSSGPGAAATTSMTPPQPEKAPPNSRTDVVLYGRQWIPKPTRHSVAFWLMDWYAGTCTADGCIQSEENKNQTISLLEAKSKDGPWEPGGDPSKGQASDWISIERRTFYQRWFVDGKQVQLVIGRDRNRDPITTWQLRVVIPKWGERPVYYPVD